MSWKMSLQKQAWAFNYDRESGSGHHNERSPITALRHRLPK